MNRTDRIEVTLDSQLIPRCAWMNAVLLADRQRVNIAQEGSPSWRGPKGKRNGLVHAGTEQHGTMAPTGGSCVTVERNLAWPKMLQHP